MPTNIAKTLHALLRAKDAASVIERRFFQQLAKLVPTRVDGRGAATRVRPKRRARRRTLRCPKCSRRFALPVHLGRHLSATHGKRKKAAR